eukprot:9061993-Pyramimonas_sp.AAC.1
MHLGALVFPQIPSILSDVARRIFGSVWITMPLNCINAGNKYNRACDRVHQLLFTRWRSNIHCAAMGLASGLGSDIALVTAPAGGMALVTIRHCRLGLTRELYIRSPSKTAPQIVA